ncbi:uncharacterized protein [Triticum aestivum]|uniref:uncharacterized protein n=1 Tax=Triticum aestivum TaxID=4565 RepID=UPI001D032CE0|nr:uncharacterized protein LOC123076037 [Triticum aestivum]
MRAMLAGAEEQQGEGCSSSARRCGSFTISHPFWLSNSEAQRSYGPQDFEVACHNKNFPGLRSSIPSASNLGFAIIDISYKENSLRVVDQGNLEILQASNSCHGTILNTSVKLAQPFRINPVGLSLILYNCTEESAAAAATVARRDRDLVKTGVRCRNESNVLVHTGVPYTTGNYGGYALKGCEAVVVPVMGSSGEANMSNYEQLISDGFLLTWDPPEPLPLPAPAPLHAPARTCKFTRQIIYHSGL